MTPEDAINSLDRLMSQLNTRYNLMLDESHAIATQWVQLGRVGGQRADHAANLLSRLRHHFHGIASFCTTCEKQIDQLLADPFGRKKEAPHADEEENA